MKIFNLILLGIYCLGCACFGKDFAKIHISIFDFPVFIGEILLGYCLLFCWRKLKWLWLLIGFILIKATFGLHFYGLLTFRHSALFYYPLFAFVIYSFYDRKMFTGKALALSAGALAFWWFFGKGMDYFSSTYLILAIILAINIKHKIIRYGIFVLIIITSPFSLMFSTIRAVLISNIIAFIFLSMYLRLRYRLLLVAVVVILSLNFAGLDIIKSVFPLRTLITGYIEHSERYRRLIGTYKPKQCEVSLYDVGKNDPLYEEAAPREAAPGEAAPEEAAPEEEVDHRLRILGAKRNSVLWRLMVWRDMLEEVRGRYVYFGMPFGKPFRSKTMDVLVWNTGAWVGWLEPHNSFIHILYRAGIVGFWLIIFLWILIVKMAMRVKKFPGIMLVALVIYWMMVANFAVILELPYYAIPFWCLFGAAMKEVNRYLK